MPIPDEKIIIDINGARMNAELQEQGRIGWQDGIGLFRECYSESYDQARAYLENKMQEAGLQTRVDTVGNLFGRLPGSEDKAPAILCGSHLDSVAAGGIYDGHYGIYAALEAVRSIEEHGIRLKHGLEIAAFSAEEGGVLGGTFGSRAFCGKILDAPPRQAMDRYGLDQQKIAQARGNLESYYCFLEAHVEQGPVLWRRGLSVGIPTGIVGISRYRCTVYGEANHAGTTPLQERKDALYESIVLLHHWLDYMHKQTDMVCNVAEIGLFPGKIGVVNGRVDFMLEIRSINIENTERVVKAFREMLSQMETCRAEMHCIVVKPPVKLDEGLIALLEQSGRDLGMQPLLMPSGASHDASSFYGVIPAAMIFVPSRGGISHNKEEYTPAEDLTRGALLLANAILRIDATEKI